MNSAIRTMRAFRQVATAAVLATTAGCHSDSLTASYEECAGQPGCQSATAAVAPEVVQSLDDGNSRVTAALHRADRETIEIPLGRLKSALVQRDIERGRAAFDATIDAITRAERAHPESRPDLGALRLSLVPAARSLGLPVSRIDAPLP